jgi:hypothetical protein
MLFAGDSNPHHVGRTLDDPSQQMMPVSHAASSGDDACQSWGGLWQLSSGLYALRVISCACACFH